MSSEHWDESLFNFGFLPHCWDCFISWSAVIAMIFCNVSLFFFWKLYICSWHLFHILYEHWSSEFIWFFFSCRGWVYCLEIIFFALKSSVSFINTLLFSRWKHFLLLIIWWNHILFHVITLHVIPLESLIAFSNHCSPSPSSASLLFLVLLAHTYFLFF